MQILLAVDGSDQSMDAAQFLAKLPFREKPHVLVASVLADSQFDGLAAEAGVQIRELDRESASKTYAEVSQTLKQAGMPCEHMVSEGHAAKTLLRSAKERDVDLIVMAARGHSIVARALLGSTSDAVANHAHCPVLVVRRANTAAPPEKPFRVVLAYDGSAGSKVAAEQLFGLAWDTATEIQITTLLERPPLLPDEEIYDTDAIHAAENRLIELVAASKCAANVSYRVRETVQVGGAISVLAEREDGDMIFVGETGKSAITQFFLGSTARHVLHHSPCSVWIARTKNWQQA